MSRSIAERSHRQDCASPNGDPIAATGSPTRACAVAERQRSQRRAPSDRSSAARCRRWGPARGPWPPRGCRRRTRRRPRARFCALAVALGRDHVRVGDDLALAVEHEPRRLAPAPNSRSTIVTDAGPWPRPCRSSGRRSRPRPGPRRPARVWSPSWRWRGGSSPSFRRTAAGECRRRRRRAPAAGSRAAGGPGRRWSARARAHGEPPLHALGGSSRAIARPSPAPCACSLGVKKGSEM